MRRMTMCAAVVFVLVVVVARGQAKPAAGPVTFKDGEAIVFLGDSIMHHWEQTESFCQYIENYYYTRYPKKHLRFINAGVSGSLAKHAFERFDQAVAAYKPKYVVVMLGMNDAGYVDFDPAKFVEYQREMRHLLDQIGFLKATAIPMVPTLLDYRNVAVNIDNTPQKMQTLLGNVCTLGYYGTWLREEALERGLPLVEQASGFTRFLWDVRRVYPEYMLALDGIHPTPAGMLVMAHSFIEAMETNRVVSRVDLLISQGKVLAACEGGKLTDTMGHNGAVRFVFHANSLPWVLPPEKDAMAKVSAAFAYRQLDAGRMLGRELVRVSGLLPNTYELKIDGQSVGTYDFGQLALGIDLQDNPKTPQYQQALAVAAINAEKTRGPMFMLGKEYERVRDTGGIGDTETLARLDLQIRDYEKQIYAANQPKPHRYEIVPFVKPGAVKK